MKFLMSGGRFQAQSGLPEVYRLFPLPNPILSQSFTDMDSKSVSVPATAWRHRVGKDNQTHKVNV